MLIRNMRDNVQSQALVVPPVHANPDPPPPDDEHKHDGTRDKPVQESCLSGEDDDPPEEKREDAPAEEKREDENQGEERSSEKYRYGNPLLGLKSQLPEVAGIATYSHFNTVRNDKYREWHHCLVTRKFMPFAKCDCCTEFRAKSEATKDKAEKARLSQEYKKHIYFVIKERRVYYTHAMMATRHPREYLSLIIDGADQSDHGLPHFHNRSHKTEAAWKMKLHLMGVIAHGRGSFLYTCPSHAAQGHNVTIQALWRTILHLKEAEGTLPPKLYLQLDNTTKQCKGKYIHAFLALLVHFGVFK